MSGPESSPEPDDRSSPTSTRTPSRIIAVVLCVFGGVAVLLWASRAMQSGSWWQVLAAMAVWGLHVVVARRLWRQE